MSFVVTLPSGTIAPQMEIEVITSLDTIASRATLKSESPILANPGQFSDEAIRVAIGEMNVFTGQAEIERGGGNGDTGYRFSVEARSFARNIADSFIQNHLTPAEEFDNQSIGKIFQRTMDLEGHSRESYSIETVGATRNVDSWRWFESDRIGIEMQQLAEEYECVFTDDESGVIRVLSDEDLSQNESVTFDVRESVKFEYGINYSQRYSSYVGFGSTRTEKGKSTGKFRSEFEDSRVSRPRKYARVYRESFNQNQLTEAVSFDALRRRSTGMSVKLEIPDLVFYRKGQHATIVLDPAHPIALDETGWIIHSIRWSQTTQQGSRTHIDLVPANQFARMPEIGPYEKATGSELPNEKR